jgi:hypothetical protein
MYERHRRVAPAPPSLVLVVAAPRPRENGHSFERSRRVWAGAVWEGVSLRARIRKHRPGKDLLRLRRGSPCGLSWADRGNAVIARIARTIRCGGRGPTREHDWPRARGGTFLSELGRRLLLRGRAASCFWPRALHDPAASLAARRRPLLRRAAPRGLTPIPLWRERRSRPPSSRRRRHIEPRAVGSFRQALDPAASRAGSTNKGEAMRWQSPPSRWWRSRERSPTPWQTSAAAG